MIELHEIEELFKSVNRNAIKAFLRNAAVLKDPEATPEMKALAEENVKAISQNKPIPKPKAPTPQVPAKPQTPLEQAMAAGKQKSYDNSSEKMKAAAAQLEQHNANVVSGFRAEKRVEREAQRQEEKKKQLLPGSDHTLHELQVHADRVTRDPNASPEKPLARRMATPAQAAKQVRAKQDRTISNALDLAHKLHNDGDADSAHTILSAIPREHLPKELQRYNPTYLHYNVSPNLWSQMSPEHQEHVHNFHNEVMTGVHNESPDAATKAMVSKVHSIAKPTTSE